MKKLSSLVLALLFGTVLFAQNDPSGLLVNDAAPDFAASTGDGQILQLSSALKKGKVVLVFYRGEWCPYCNRQLSALQDSSALILEKGAEIWAITPEKQENITKTVSKTKADFPILHDQGLKIMQAYKVAFPVDQKTIDQYKKFKIDLTEVNGENGANLPVPAVYIIDEKGKIIYRYFDKDYRKRPSVKEILSHL